jgi:hypothetical protein
MGMDEEGIDKNKTKLWMNLNSESSTFLQQVPQNFLRKAAGNFGGFLCKCVENAVGLVKV